MKIFVTGATGFLGKHLVQRLIADNHEVLVLTRTKNSLSNFQVQEVVGNLTDIRAWENMLSECDAVVHCAAKVEFWGDWQSFYNDNTVASVELLKSADRHKVKRFVYISSESVLQDKKDLLDIDETHPYPQEPSSYYGKSKMLAEKQIQAFTGNIHKIILRPTFIYGPGVKGMEIMKEKIQSGDFMWVDKGNVMIEMVYVKNVVEAIVRSLTNGQNNAIYNITDHSQLTAKQFFTELLATQKVSMPDKNIPAAIAKPAAWFIENIWRLLGLKSNPPLTRFDLSFIAMNRRYKTDKAINELGYKPIYSTTEALKEMSMGAN